MAHKPVGNCVTFATSGTSAKSSAISQQASALRVVSVGQNAHVAVGPDPTATAANYYLVSNVPETISLGNPTSQRVVGITTGATTTIDFPEGTGCPFGVGDAVSLTVTGQTTYNFSHKLISSIDTSAGEGGYFSTRIVVANDSSSGNPAALLSTSYAELRGSFKVAVKNSSGNGNVFVQQVQVSGDA